MSRLMNRLVNPLVAWLLGSPWHGLLSGSTMLVTVTGRRSGQRYTTPVNYVAGADGALTVLSKRERRWWRNLRGGAPLTLRWRGADVAAHGEVIEEEPQRIATALQQGWQRQGRSLPDATARHMATAWVAIHIRPEQP